MVLLQPIVPNHVHHHSYKRSQKGLYPHDVDELYFQDLVGTILAPPRIRPSMFSQAPGVSSMYMMYLSVPVTVNRSVPFIGA